LIDLYRANDLPKEMFPSRDPEKSARIMKAMDALNARESRGAIRPATVLASPGRAGGQKHVSPRFTTKLDEIMVAYS